MAHYLVTAVLHADLLADLSARLTADEFREMRPFGRALTHSLRNARLRPDGVVVWEEEDYCHPPLAQERAAVLDQYFDNLHVEPVEAGDGWLRTEGLSLLFPDLAERRVA